MGGVFLARKIAPKVEVINDLSRDVYNLFLVVQSHPEALTKAINLHLFSREGFKRLIATLFYLDPPYYGCEDYYGKNLFSREDFQKMSDQLATIKGQFIMSINNHPEIRRIFARFKIEEIETKYSIRQSQKVVELLISKL